MKHIFKVAIRNELPCSWEGSKLLFCDQILEILPDIEDGDGLEISTEKEGTGQVRIILKLQDVHKGKKVYWPMSYNLKHVENEMKIDTNENGLKLYLRVIKKEQGV